MRYKHRAVFSLDKKKMVNFLKKNNRDFEEDKSINIGIYYFYEDDTQFKDLKSIMEKENLFSIITTEFDLKEMNGAQWLSVRSKWLNGYPYPLEGYDQSLYGVDKKEECLCHKKQIGNIRIPKDIKWGPKRFFCSINWLSDELLVNKKIIDLLDNSGLRGFYFRDIEVKSKISQTAKQLVVEEYLDTKLDIEKNFINTIVICERCKQRKIVGGGKEDNYPKSAFESIGVDIIKSKSVYGDGYMADRKTYISQRFYRFLIENKLDKSLVFEPVTLY